MFIGFYSIANAVTLFGLISSVTACFLAANGNVKYAIYMMVLACLCDTFDGRIARSKPNRTAKEKFFGVQLDSLCDTVSFGVTPCVIAFNFGFDGWFDVLVYCFFIACGTIRLAYFNTLSFQNKGEPMKTFRGIPIPMSTVVISALFVLTTFIDASVTVWIFRIALLLLGLGFVLNIKVKKPNMKSGAIFLGVQILLLLILLIAGECRAPIA